MNDLSVITREFGDLSEWEKRPDFWLALPRDVVPFTRTLKEGTTRVIGRSAGGRDILAIEYGEKEPLDATTDNLHSCIASSIVPPDPTAIFPAAFFGTKRRRKPVVVLQGALHGSEFTGTVASLNLCRIIETGRDLRGKAWPRLQELARATRLCIIPWINVDGADRTPWAHHSNMPHPVAELITQGMAKDGRKYKYPAVKAICPIPPDTTAFMGTYYNDAGVNLQYDFCMPERQPETVAWMKYYLSEKPDGIVCWHCNAGSLIGPPGYYMPPGYQIEEARLAGAVRARLLREGLRAGRVSWAGLPGMGKPGIEQITAAFFVTGALSILCELPSGCREWYMSCDEMLDMGLLTIEEILFYAHTDGLRPYELWEKVRKQLDAPPRKA